MVFSLLLSLLLGIPYSRNSGIPKGFDEADEEVETEGTPALGTEVVIREGGVVLGAFTPSSGQRFRMMLLGNEVKVEGADRFADRAVFLEVGEAVNAGAEEVGKMLIVPTLLGGDALEGFARELCATQEHGGVLAEIVRAEHDAAEFSEIIRHSDRCLSP